MLQNAIESGYLNKSSKIDYLDTNYDHLLLEIRRVEKEISINKNPDKVSAESRGQRLH